MNREQIFLKEELYPDALNLFGIELKKLDNIKDKCIFILDTNVLLLPYTTTKESFEEINKLYSSLIGENRLFIPEQVAREFVSNRPEKIKDVYKKLNNAKSKIENISLGKYPLLESLEDFKLLEEIQKEINKKTKEYSEKIEELLKEIKKWGLNDPISIKYKELFKAKIIKGINDYNEEKVFYDLKRRNEFNIPPGFKDKGKNDLGIGDLLIWLTILSVAKEENKDVVFVSGDEKNDWFYRIESTSLYPRFELISEFNRETNGKTFHIIKLSELLELYGKGENQIVDEIKAEERRINIISEIKILEDNATNDKSIEDMIYRWLSDKESKKIVKCDDNKTLNFILEDKEKKEGIIIKDLSKNTFSRFRYLEKDFRKIILGNNNINCIRYIYICNSSKNAIMTRKRVKIHNQEKNEFVEREFGYIKNGEFVEI